LSPVDDQGRDDGIERSRESSRRHAALTEGSLVKNLIKLALPFLVPNLLHLIVIVADRMWIGDVGTDAMAGLGVAHAALMVCVTTIMGPAIGTLGRVARSIGAGEPDEAMGFFGQGMLIGALVGVLFASLAIFLPAPLMDLMNAGDVDAAVFSGARDYLAISMFGLLFNGPLFVLTFGIQGAGDGKSAFLIGAIAPLVNLILDPLLIFNAGLGLAGAAWATVIAYGLALFFGVVLVSRRHREFRLEWRNVTPVWARAMEIVQVGIPGTLEQLVRTCALLLMVGLLAQFGAVVLSAYTATIVITMTLVLPGLAFGQATAALMGQNLGAQKPLRAWRTAWTSVWMYAGVMLIAASCVWVWAAPLIGLFDDHPDVIAEGTELLRILTISFPAVAIALILSKAFVGASTTLPPMTAAAIAHLFFQIPCAWYLSLDHGALGAYVAMTAAFYVHAGLNALLFWRRFRVT
jgi:putative MATE family efflux protein